MTPDRTREDLARAIENERSKTVPYRIRLFKRKKIWMPTAGMFMMLTIITWLNEILDFPCLLLGTCTPVNWQEAFLETGLIVVFGIFTVLKVHHDTGELRQVNKKLRAAYQIINRSPAVAFVWKNAEGWPVEFVSDNVEKLFGFTAEEFTAGRVSYASTLHSHDLDRVKEEVSTNSANGRINDFVHKPYRILTKKGETKWLYDVTFIRRNENESVTHYEGIVLDISPRMEAIRAKRMLEAELEQARKMEAIGTLAGGIAHDFNNVLQAIIANTELALEDLPDNSDAAERLAQVLAACERATSLVKQILVFSRKRQSEIKPLRMYPIVKESLKLLRSFLPADVEIRRHIHEGRETVLADPTQIHQIMMNLCTNAAHAMHRNGGILEVNLTPVNINPVGEDAPAMPAPGPYMELRVSDTGHGMDLEVLNRMFDPFYTTKSAGEGSGIGLSVVHGIVKQCNGVITAESLPGKGTIFRVLIPRYTDSGGEPSIEETFGPLPRGNEQILFVDDEDFVCNAQKAVLEKLGYSVVAKTNSLEALEIFVSQPEQFDLVITDQTMPKLTGAELAKRMIAIRTDIPIILCSGFSDLIDPDGAQSLGIRAFLTKPILSAEMAKAVRRVLGGKGTRQAFGQSSRTATDGSL